MKFLIYCRDLQFEERPDYNYLINLLEEILEDEGCKNDYIYDWDINEEIYNKNNNDNCNSNEYKYKSELKKKGNFIYYFFFFFTF